MKYTLTVLLLLFSANFVQAQDNADVDSETTLIFVRHAEKADDGTNDPPLNDLGKSRAVKLAKLLSDNYDIAAIFSTNYKRTINTGKPLADQLGFTIQIYDFSDPLRFLTSARERYAGSAVLIVGHSNSTPMLVNLLLGSEKYDAFPEEEYGTYFIVKVHEDGSIVDSKETY